MAMDAMEVLGGIWRQAGLPPDALSFARLSGAEPVLPSSFAVGIAAQSTIAAAALAACELGHLRGTARQQVGVDAVFRGEGADAEHAVLGLQPHFLGAGVVGHQRRNADAQVDVEAVFEFLRGAGRHLVLGPGHLRLLLSC